MKAVDSSVVIAAFATWQLPPGKSSADLPTTH